MLGRLLISPAWLGVPNTSWAGVEPSSSLGAARRPMRTHGRWSIQFAAAQRARRVYSSVSYIWYLNKTLAARYLLLAENFVQEQAVKRANFIDLDHQSLFWALGTQLSTAKHYQHYVSFSVLCYSFMYVDCGMWSVEALGPSQRDETRKGWPLPTVETWLELRQMGTQVTSSTYERGSSLVGLLCRLCQYKRFLSCLMAALQNTKYPVQNIFFLTWHYFISYVSSPSKLGRQSCRVTWLLISVSGPPISKLSVEPRFCNRVLKLEREGAVLWSEFLILGCSGDTRVLCAHWIF